MTHKYSGKITFDGNKITMPSCTDIPPKTQWFNASIWQFNGKAYKPLTQQAIDNLEDIVKQVEATGKTKATKDGKRKPTSIKYAILTTGVEPFEVI